MYGWIWRALPGHTPAKLGGALVLLLAVVALLFFVVFPAIEPHLPATQVTVAWARGPPTTPKSVTSQPGLIGHGTYVGNPSARAR